MASEEGRLKVSEVETHVRHFVFWSDFDIDADMQVAPSEIPERLETARMIRNGAEAICVKHCGELLTDNLKYEGAEDDDDDDWPFEPSSFERSFSFKFPTRDAANLAVQEAVREFEEYGLHWVDFATSRDGESSCG